MQLISRGYEDKRAKKHARHFDNAFEKVAGSKPAHEINVDYNLRSLKIGEK